MKTNLHSKELFDKAYGNRTWEFYRDIFSDCILYGQPGQWLDIGAGLGLFTECADRFGIKCIGLEGSEDGVKAAKLRYPNMDIRQHLLEDRLPLNDSSISTIICNQVIEHLAPQTAKNMLKECYRVLKTNGVIFIYSPSKKYVKKERVTETHVNLYSPKSLKKEVESAGFKVIRMDNSPKMFFGSMIFPRYISKMMFKILPFDILSSTSNCIAVKTK